MRAGRPLSLGEILTGVGSEVFPFYTLETSHSR